MKLNLTTLFSLLLFVNSTLAMQFVQNVLEYVTGRSRIPQFILDTRHPWLEANKGWLNRLDDPEHALCSLDSSLRPGNGDASDRTYPPDLFTKLEINNNRAGVDRGGWSNSLARLKEIQRCPAALRDIVDFDIQIYVSDGRYGRRYNQLFAEGPVPPAELPALFLEVLSSMPKLTKLTWDTFGENYGDFQKEFARTNVSLPSVRHLVPSTYMHGLIALCPNLETIESGGSTTNGYWRWRSNDPRLALIRAASNISHVTSFSMEGEWELIHLKAVQQAMPRLTSLDMAGELMDPHSWNNEDLGVEKDKSQGLLLKAHLAVLAQLPKLQHLRLPSSSDLGLGFEGGSGCGNAYFGPDGRASLRSLSRRYAQTTEIAAAIVLPALPNLKSLAIGGHQAILTLNKNGQLNASWAWTDRMTEWALASWPKEDPSEDDFLQDRYDPDDRISQETRYELCHAQR